MTDNGYSAGLGARERSHSIQEGGEEVVGEEAQADLTALKAPAVSVLSPSVEAVEVVEEVVDLQAAAEGGVGADDRPDC